MIIRDVQTSLEMSIRDVQTSLEMSIRDVQTSLEMSIKDVKTSDRGRSRPVWILQPWGGTPSGVSR